MKKVLCVLLAAAQLVLLAACGGGSQNAAPGTSPGTEQPASTANTASGTRKLVIYSPNADDQVNLILPEFEKQSGITVELVSLGSGDCVARADAEQGNPQADVIWGIGSSIAENNLHLWEPYVSPNDTNLHEEYQNVDGYYTKYNLSGSAALLINLDVFAELGLDPDEFDSYEDLLWPELRGHIAMGDPAASSSAYAELTNMLLVKGDEPYSESSWEWVEQFITQLDGIVLSSSSQVYKGTVDGEYAVGVTYEEPCISLLDDGADNVRLIYPTEGAVWLPAAAGIIRGCQHLEEAQEFIDFLISEDCQRLYALTTTRPIMTELPLASPNLLPFSEIHVVFEDMELCARMKNEWAARWNEFLTR